MLIECLVQRDSPIVVPIGNEKYTFEPDAKGRRVAEVWLESHIECFLAVKHLYREAKPLEPETPTLVTVSDDKPTETEAAAPAKGPQSVSELRTEYERLTGKRPFGGWNGAKLREKIAAAKA